MGEWLKPESIIAVCAVIAALVSICIAKIALNYSIKESRANKLHNQLSVSPHLSFHRISSKFDPTKGIGFWLKSDGLGPVVIIKHSVLLDGIIVDDGDGQCGMHNAMVKLSINKTTTRYKCFFPGTMIMAGSESLLIIYDTKNSKPTEDSDHFYKQMDKINFVIKYKSVYGEEKELKIQVS